MGEGGVGGRVGTLEATPRFCPYFPSPAQAHVVLQRAFRSPLRLAHGPPEGLPVPVAPGAWSSRGPSSPDCTSPWHSHPLSLKAHLSKLGNNTPCLAKRNAFLPFLPFPQRVPYRTKWVRCSSLYICWNIQVFARDFQTLHVNLLLFGVSGHSHNVSFSLQLCSFELSHMFCVCVHYLFIHSTNIYRVCAICQSWTRYRVWWWENRDSNLLTVLFWYKREATQT